LLASLLTFTGTHQGGSNTLYRAGISLKDQSISLNSWGSGICSETEEDAFEGSTSIRVTTKNLFQGGILNWDKSIDLSSLYADKANLLRITYKSLDAAVTNGGGGKAGGPGFGGQGGGKGKGGGLGGGGLGGGDLEANNGNDVGDNEPSSDPQQGGAQGGPPGGGFGGGRQGGGRQGGPGGAPGGPPGQGQNPGGVGTSTASTLKMMRIIIGTTDGMKSEALIPATTTVSVDRDWKQAGVPLQAIKGFSRTNKIVKNISFSGDVSTAFYLGDIRVINDRTPIRAETNFKNALVNINNTLTFSAQGTGGSSVLKYTWDFDDADGIQVDAEGQTVKYRFRTASNDLKNPSTMRPNGEFTITLTVSDAYGLKEPYMTTIKVKVNP
jgi:hypothetical protein